MNTVRPLIAHGNARWLYPAAGAALVLAQAALPAQPGAAAARATETAAHAGQVTISAVFFLLAAALLALATAAALTRPLARMRRTVTVGAVLTVVGALWPACGRATYNLVMVAVTSGVTRSSGIAAARAIDQSGVFTILLLTLAAFAIGPVVLMVGLWRAKVAPVWPALLWLVGLIVVNATEASSRAVAGLGMLIAAMALAWLGSALGSPSPTEKPGSAAGLSETAASHA